MDKPNITVVFSDLEGTLLTEETGSFDPNKFQSLISNMHSLLTETSTELKFVIVSPIESRLMQPILEDLNSEFHKFNKTNGTRYQIDFAACYNDATDMDRLPNNVLPILSANVGKERVVNYLTDSLEYRFNILNTLYMGNGRNDIASINFLKNKYRKNAYAICPENSKSWLRANPYIYHGRGTDLDGLNDGFNQLLIDLKKRKSEQDPNSGIPDYEYNEI